MARPTTPEKVKPNPTLIIIDRAGYDLRLYRLTSKQRYEVTRFEITTGRIGDATPAGGYTIDARSVTPDWRVPEHRDYPEELWGKVIPFGHVADDKLPLSNPYAGGLLNLSDEGGIAIHGTSFEPRIGTRSSHGCIRMRVEDIERIYERCPIGTPVVIL